MVRYSVLADVGRSVSYPSSVTERRKAASGKGATAPSRPADAMQKLQDKAQHWEREEAAARAACAAANVTAQDVSRLQVAQQMRALVERQIETAQRAEHERERASETAKQQRMLASARKPPSLQALVEQHGGWDRVTAQAWEKFDAETRQWRAHLASGDHFVQVQRSRRERTYAEARE